MSDSQFRECRHILTTGSTCSSPAMRDKAYCYYHFRSRARHAPPPAPAAAEPASLDPVSLDPVVLHPMRADALGQAEPMLACVRTLDVTGARAVAPPLALEFPVLEDRESIQVAVSMIVAALGRNQLDGKRAATMLYGLQVAAGVTRFSVVPGENYDVVTTAVPAPDGGDLYFDDDEEEAQAEA